MTGFCPTDSLRIGKRSKNRDNIPFCGGFFALFGRKQVEIGSTCQRETSGRKSEDSKPIETFLLTGVSEVGEKMQVASLGNALQERFMISS